MAELSPLGAFFEKLRQKTTLWLVLMFVVLALLVALNFFILPEHPHFGLDKYPGFFAGFGLIFGLIMVIAMKKIVQPMISRDEEYYDPGD